MAKRTFASDNYSGVHPVIMNALLQANEGHAASYGADTFTREAEEKFRKFFGPATQVFFAYNGTGANVISLSASTRSYQAIICSELAHINVDESTAPEKFTGCKLLTVPTTDGKIYPDDVERHLIRVGDQHHAQAGMISISQSTEYGTVYTVEEIRALAEVARANHLIFHMDGARLANAAVSLQCEFAAFTVDAGVDILSFGGTKNGMMFGEAVLIFKPSLAEHMKYIRKQAMQLHSKMRYIGAQFSALFTDDLWRKSATHANHMAAMLEDELRKIEGIAITQAVDANSIFAIFPKEIIGGLQEQYFFYVWNDKTNEVRLMCSFDTTENDILEFSGLVAKAMARK
jgi:threonine aldolase